MKNALLTVALLSLFMSFAHANDIDTPAKTSYLDGLTVGALASFGVDAYATDDKVGVVPLVLYDNDYFYAEGSELGFYAHKDDKNWFRVGASYEARHFEPDDAKTTALKGLDERKPSANITLGYMHITHVGGFEVKAGADMMDRSGGQTISLAHRSYFKLADDKLIIYPKFGVNWYSEDYNQYYFGVSETESAKTGIATYKTKSSYSPFVSVSGKYQFSDHVGFFGNVKSEWLSGTQKKSPLVDDKMDIGLNAGLTYTF